MMWLSLQRQNHIVGIDEHSSGALPASPVRNAFDHEAELQVSVAIVTHSQGFAVQLLCAES
jgi:hypothetical protein